MPGVVLMPMITGSSLRCILNSCMAQVDHNLFEIVSKDDAIVEGLGIYLNSAVAFLERELMDQQILETVHLRSRV